MMTSAKSTSETSSASSSYSEPSLLAACPMMIFHPDSLTHLKEFEAPINIYLEHKGHLEEDKNARTKLGTEILNDDLYCPVQQQEVNGNKTSRGLKIKNFSSFFPRFLPTAFSSKNNYGVMASTETEYCPNDMFNTTNMFGINSVAQ